MPKYKEISRQRAQKNPAYWSVVEPIYRANPMEIKHEKDESKGESKTEHTYLNSPNPDRLLQSFKEPTNKVYLKYATLLHKGQYQELATYFFNDPDFVRHLFKALRRDKITANQLATVLQIRDCSTFLENYKNIPAPFKIHSFKEKGPYDFNSVKYATKENIQQFHEALNKLPASEKCYFSFAFAPESEITLAIRLLQRKFYHDDLPNFENALYKRIITKYVKNIAKQQQLTTLTTSRKKSDITALIHAFGKIFSAIMPTQVSLLYEEKVSGIHLSQAYLLKQLSDFWFLHSLLSVGESNPGFIISENIDEPLRFVVFTTDSLLTWQQAVHQDHTTYPLFKIGNPSSYDVLNAAMNTQQELRTVELCHPDVKRNMKPHGTDSREFLLTWHDLAFHCWRSGSILYKNWIRHLITLLQDNTGFALSKLIWEFADMDGSFGGNIRNNPPITTIANLMTANHLKQKTNGLFTSQIESTDTNLLIIIDMIKNEKYWTSTFGSDPKRFFDMDVTKVSDSHHAYKHHDSQISVNFNVYLDFASFHNTFNAMKKIILANPTIDSPNSSMFYILAYRLRSVPNSLVLCEKLYYSNWLKKIFYWNRNSGMHIHKDFYADKNMDRKQRAIESITDANKLYDKLTEIYTTLCEEEKNNAIAAANRPNRYAHFQPAAASIQNLASNDPQAIEFDLELPTCVLLQLLL